MPPVKKKTEAKSTLLRCECGRVHNEASHGATYIGTVPHFTCVHCGRRTPPSTRPQIASSTR